MILDSSELNAFSTPGGHIFIAIGLVEAAPSEDALAGIIAHELAHITLKHGMKIIYEMKITNEADILAQKAAALAGGSNARIITFRDSVNEIFYSMVKNGYSAPQEYEADASAVEMLIEAGYHPGGLAETLNILKTVQSGQGGLNSTHPPPAQRIANIEKQISQYRAPDTRSFRQERFNKIMKR
jgi:predicted Zn-dependent protease